jgi:XrtJ-associated TM-motif-TM protein
MKLRLLVLLAIVSFCCAFPLCAQNGCVDSPEDPTIFLALVAGAGALIAGARAARSRRQ